MQKRGNDVVLSFKLKPGAKPRVNQRFNQLDVVFAATEGEGTAAPSGTGSTSNRTQPGDTQNASTTTAPPTPQQRPQDDRTSPSTSSTSGETPAASNAARNSQATSNVPPAGAGTQPPADINLSAASYRRCRVSAPCAVIPRGRPRRRGGAASSNRQTPHVDFNKLVY